MHDFPVTAVAPLPPTQELYLPYVPANYKGYTCSSSADYTISHAYSEEWYSLSTVAMNYSSIVKSRSCCCYFFTFIFILLLLLAGAAAYIYYNQPDLYEVALAYATKFIDMANTYIHTEL